MPYRSGNGAFGSRGEPVREQKCSGGKEAARLKERRRLVAVDEVFPAMVVKSQTGAARGAVVRPKHESIPCASSQSPLGSNALEA